MLMTEKDKKRDTTEIVPVLSLYMFNVCVHHSGVWRRWW